MKVTIIYSNPIDEPQLKELSDSVENSFAENHELIRRFNLAENNLKYCTGCWSCWWTTPGECVLKDGISEIYKAVLECELLVFISALSMGSVSSELKTLIERLVPLIHPYTIIVDKEVHHRKRYERYPDMAAILGVEEDTDDEDRAINIDYFNRLVKNFHSNMRFIEFTSNIEPEAVNELLAD